MKNQNDKQKPTDQEIDLDRLVRHLRDRFQLSEDDCSDVELIQATNGTLNRDCVEMKIAIDNFKKAMASVIPMTSKILFS